MREDFNLSRDEEVWMMGKLTSELNRIKCQIWYNKKATSRLARVILAGSFRPHQKRIAKYKLRHSGLLYYNKFSRLCQHIFSFLRILLWIIFETNRGIILEWATQSKTDNLGFNSLRGCEVDGRFEQVNAQLITGAGNSAVAHNYIFMDRNVQPSRSYC